ncbi:hypothetical protein N7489_002452 [Penicillium chrysogenum]|jgi:hypothetical protein|uniref:uncharacterized protein n=1 Tax=Penicillium chrysogenum TaxID=5076 RepID=UPI0023954CB6|nr:uncharacterized protein N7489_002452 [Penicillium chrysogenum]KAJ5248221.1 hypothetical protein N7524_012181 [Penicillium chrysogenum]KAJ5252042.1 hypothetical protein N7489_002452 [Penicillium chrysogenum]KAJ6146299.1 hypothetical protein N7497_008281 [Penicillium chrysogenum]
MRKTTGHAEREFISKAEMIAALSILPPNVRLLIANEACYSGSWATIDPDLGANRDVLIETAATVARSVWLVGIDGSLGETSPRRLTIAIPVG